MQETMKKSKKFHFTLGQKITASVIALQIC